VHPELDYPSYSDFWRLVELGGFSTCSLTYAHKNLNNASHTFIFVTPAGIPDCSNARARCIFWQFEYAGDYANQPNHLTCKEQWSSDPHHAACFGAKYVLLGGNPHLAPFFDSDRDPKWDIVTLSYLTDRRRSMYKQITGYNFAPDYPGHDTKERHEQLYNSRCLLHVHQHDEPAIAPIKMALAAAYRLPVVCEAVFDPGPYAEAILFATYDNLPKAVDAFLQGHTGKEDIGDILHHELCIEHTFEQEVRKALEDRA
jgi:hypothetical protein